MQIVYENDNYQVEYHKNLPHTEQFQVVNKVWGSVELKCKQLPKALGVAEELHMFISQNVHKKLATFHPMFNMEDGSPEEDERDESMDDDIPPALETKSRH